MLTAPRFPPAAGIPERTARSARASAAQGKPWRGHVVQRPCARGTAWALDPSRATPQLLAAVAELQALRAQLETPAGTDAPKVARDHARRTERARERLAIIRPVPHTAPRSRARGVALRAVAEDRHLVKGALERVPLPPLKRWVADFEREGLAGLMPKPSNITGARRVLVSRAWDKGMEDSVTARRNGIAPVHVVRHRLGLTDAAFRLVPVSTAGFTAAKEPDRDGVSAVPGCFEYLGWTPRTARRPDHGTRAGMASVARRVPTRTPRHGVTRARGGAAAPAT